MTKYEFGMCFDINNEENNCGKVHKIYSEAYKHMMKQKQLYGENWMNDFCDGFRWVSRNLNEQYPIIPNQTYKAGMCFNSYRSKNCGILHDNKTSVVQHLKELGPEWDNLILKTIKESDEVIEHYANILRGAKDDYKYGMCYAYDSKPYNCGTKHVSATAAKKHLKNLGFGWTNDLVYNYDKGGDDINTKKDKSISQVTADFINNQVQLEVPPQVTNTGNTLSFDTGKGNTLVFNTDYGQIEQNTLAELSKEAINLFQETSNQKVYEALESQSAVVIKDEVNTSLGGFSISAKVTSKLEVNTPKIDETKSRKKGFEPRRLNI